MIRDVAPDVVAATEELRELVMRLAADGNAHADGPVFDRWTH